MKLILGVKISPALWNLKVDGIDINVYDNGEIYCATLAKGAASDSFSKLKTYAVIVRDKEFWPEILDNINDLNNKMQTVDKEKKSFGENMTQVTLKEGKTVTYNHTNVYKMDAQLKTILQRMNGLIDFGSMINKQAG